MGLSSYIWSAVPFVAMITVECTDVGLSVISKAALSKGMSNMVSVVYFNALGTLILLPYFIFCRNKQAPLTLSLLWRFFLLGLIGSSGQIVFLTGVKFSSSTLSSALVNLIPIFTFLLAVIFRMEKLEKRTSSQAKVLGAIVAVTGAFVATLYKGPPVLINSSPSNLLQQPLFSHQSRWIIGGFLILLVCLSSSTWNVLQAIFGSLFRIAIHTWCLQKKGPVYVAMFKPLGIPVAVVLSVTFLGESLFLGSVIGSVIILLGFYTVIWGQAKEKVMVLENEASGLESSHQKTPLLHNI
ncbi:hypothetical protein V6N13_111865 [Hibiscus sabdariffa]|uniref:WAT1-related protein n=1 Tax=Hibiscus sabdariffa TaxID=183260 RepID=A0ABR2TM07_9ROSI